jgi:hypothetical protein
MKDLTLKLGILAFLVLFFIITLNTQSKVKSLTETVYTSDSLLFECIEAFSDLSEKIVYNQKILYKVTGGKNATSGEETEFLKLFVLDSTFETTEQILSSEDGAESDSP